MAPVVLGVVLAGVLIGGAVWAARRRPEQLPEAEAGPALGPIEPAEAPSGPAVKAQGGVGTAAARPAAGVAADSQDDETALARMLASEDERRDLRVVVGWITTQRALRSGRSLYDFLTRGKGYGPFYVWEVNSAGERVRKASGRHASTAAEPDASTRALARAILDGRAVPSAAILKHVPGSWVERDVTLTDEQIINKQKDYKEGIYAQIQGTKWVLFSRDTLPINIAPFATATDRLNALPKVPAVAGAVS